LWSCGFASCWRMRTNKTQELCIPTKAYACLSTPWSLGNLYTAKPCQGRESFRRFKMGTCQLREKTLTEKHRSSRIAGGWRKVDSPTQKMTCREIRKEGSPWPTQCCGATANDNDDNDNDDDDGPLYYEVVGMYFSLTWVLDQECSLIFFSDTLTSTQSRDENFLL
jgi:hypothetical protein